MHRCDALLRTAIVASALALPAMSDAEEPKVGVALAVNPDAVGQPPAQAARTLVVGVAVLHRERIATTQAGQVQIQFLDQSSLTIAPNSELTIDEFVYDPNRSGGQFAAQISSGIVRYVGGLISKNSKVVFKTPSATIGIRGGMAFISVVPGGATQATFVFGQTMSVSAGGVTRTITESGRFVVVPRAGQPPSAPAPVSNQAIQATVHALLGPHAPAGQPPVGQAASVGRALQGAAVQGPAAAALLKQFVAASPTPNVPAVPGLSTADQATLRRAAAFNDPLVLGHATQIVVQRNPNLTPAIAGAVSGRMPSSALASIVAPVALRQVPPEVLAAVISGSPQAQEIVKRYLQGQGLTTQAVVQRATLIEYAVRGTSIGADPQILLTVAARVVDMAKSLFTTPDAKLAVEQSIFVAGLSLTEPPAAGKPVVQPAQPGQPGPQPLDVIQPPAVSAASPS